MQDASVRGLHRDWHLQDAPEIVCLGSPVGGNLGQPDCGLNCLDLTEKRTDVSEFVMAPMLQKARGIRCDLPVVRIRQISPLIHLEAKLVDDGSLVILLLFGRNAFAFIENEVTLIPRPLRFLGLGMGVMNSARRRPCAISCVG